MNRAPGEATGEPMLTSKDSYEGKCDPSVIPAARV
jgi:hypothetical protein